MSSILNHPGMPALLSSLGLLVAVSLSIAVLRRLRRATNPGHTNAADLVRNFEEMHREGDISEAEFRTIHTVLGKKPANKQD